MGVAGDPVRLLVELEPHVRNLGARQDPQPYDSGAARPRAAHPDDGPGDPYVDGGFVLDVSGAGQPQGGQVAG